MFAYGTIITNASSAIFSIDCARNIRNNYYDYKGAGDWLFWAGIVEQGNAGDTSTSPQLLQSSW